MLPALGRENDLHGLALRMNSSSGAHHSAELVFRRRGIVMAKVSNSHAVQRHVLTYLHCSRTYERQEEVVGALSFLAFWKLGPDVLSNLA